MHVLFVCTGNICRSPLAERLATVMSAQMGAPGISSASCGVRAVIGSPIHPQAAAIIEEFGGDTTGFAARQINPRIASAADLILTMTREQRGAVLEVAPRQLRRTFTLAEAAELATRCGARNMTDLAALRSHVPPTSDIDIDDPIGQSPDFFSAVGARIAQLLPPVLQLCAGHAGG